MAITKEVNIVVKESGMDSVNNSIANLENAVQQTEQSTKSFRQQLRDANEELLRMSQKFGETSAEAVQAAKKVADLKDQMGFANDLVKSFNPDQKFKALSSATQLAGTGLQGVTSGMALFGDQSESTEKALLQVQSAMAFSDAISNLSNLGDEWANLKTTIASGTIVTKTNNVATAAAVAITKLFGKAVDENSKAFKGLKYAIIGTGIGALVVGVGMLISNFDKVKQVVLNFIPGLARTGDVIMGIVNSVTDFIGVTSKADRAIELQKKQAEKSLKQNKKYLELNEQNLSEAKKREIERNNEHFERLASGEYTKEESIKILRKKGIQDQKEMQETANKELVEKQKNQKEKLIQDLKDRSSKEIQILKDKFKDEKISFEEQRKKINEDNKLSKEDKLNFIKEVNKEEKELKIKNEEDVLNLKNEYENKLEDLLADTEEKKLELEEKRALEELNKLENNEKAKIKLLEYYQKKKENLVDEKKKEEDEKKIEQKEIDSENEELEFEDRLNLLNERENLIKDSLFLNEEEKTKFLKENADKKKQIELDIVDAKRKANNAEIELGFQTIGLLGMLGEKNKKLQKAMLLANSALSIAQIINDTNTGAGKEVASKGVLGLSTSTILYAKMGLSIASVLAATAKGLKGIGESGNVEGGSGNNAGGGGGASPQAPSFNLIQGTSRNQIAESLQTQAPLKAFVVAKDVTTGQSLDRNIIEDARL